MSFHVHSAFLGHALNVASHTSWDEWMNDLRFCDLFTLLQSYKDNKRVIMKCCEQLNGVYRLESFTSPTGIQPGTTRSARQGLTSWDTAVPRCCETTSIYLSLKLLWESREKRPEAICTLSFAPAYFHKQMSSRFTYM